MKRVLLFLGILLIASSLHAQDVFKKHGVNKEMLTLSKGKYKEVFTNNEVVQIGTVLLNTKSSEVVKFLEEENAEISYKEEYSSRFLTPDPLCEKYYSISPYVYCNNNPVRYIDPTGMDWIEKNGNVEWRPDATKDNVPKGYTYIGTEYQGITIDTYSHFKGESGKNYLTVRIGYKDSNSKENSYNWVQTVERDSSGEPFVDYDNTSKEGRENYPYYQGKSENEASRNQDGYDITYFDRPSEKDPDGSFKAEVSLIGDPLGTQVGNQSFPVNSGSGGKNIYVPKITLQYGFSVTNGKMSVSPIKVVTPSPYQKQTIDKIR